MARVREKVSGDFTLWFTGSPTHWLTHSLPSSLAQWLTHSRLSHSLPCGLDVRDRKYALTHTLTITCLCLLYVWGCNRDIWGWGCTLSFPSPLLRFSPLVLLLSHLWHLADPADVSQQEHPRHTRYAIGSALFESCPMSHTIHVSCMGLCITSNQCLLDTITPRSLSLELRLTCGA